MYAELRAQEVAAKVPHSYTTARTLLSILRLSQALARLRFSNTIARVGDHPVPAGCNQAQPLFQRGLGRGGGGIWKETYLGMLTQEHH